MNSFGLEDLALSQHFLFVSPLLGGGGSLLILNVNYENMNMHFWQGKDLTLRFDCWWWSIGQWQLWKHEQLMVKYNYENINNWWQWWLWKHEQLIVTEKQTTIGLGPLQSGPLYSLNNRMLKGAKTKRMSQCPNKPNLETKASNCSPKKTVSITNRMEIRRKTCCSW